MVYRDPLKENCPPILATTTRILSLDNGSTTLMAKKSRASWKDRIKTGDNVMVGGLSTDIVIPVMGPTGAGKSTFINILLGKNAMPIGHNISSCTSTLQYAIIDNPSPRVKGHRVIIVDTPGFDDTYEDDVEILRRIALWLASSHDANMTLGGVIYLLSIADKRLINTTRRNLDMFYQLCGEKALARVVLGTTNWGEVDGTVGEKREEQLAKTFCNTMINSGSKFLRFDRTESSAWAFLDAILDQLIFGENGEILNDNILQIQNEIVDLERRIPETAAGKELRYTDKQLRKMQKKEGNFEKSSALSASMEKRIKNDSKMTKNLPVMILLMGEVGAGKSTFINTVAGKNLTKVGEEGDLYPCTSSVEHYVIQHHKSEVVLVDTPGFNHPIKTDGDILKEIVNWMKNKCPENIQFGGIIYLHDLSQNREPSGAERMMTPTKLSGHESHRIVMATVGDSDAAKRRENQLKSSIWRGVQTCQFRNTQESAWRILDTILGVDPIKLQDILDDLDRICNTLPTQFAPRPNRSFFSLFGSLFSTR